MPYLQTLENPGLQSAVARLGIKPPNDVLLVFLGEKKLCHFRGGELIRSWSCSSGRLPPSCRENSLGTPLGLHAVARKIGDQAAPGTVFIGREDTGQRYWEREDFGPEQKMFVTTRILWLRGLEPGLNSGEGCDTFNRYVYIHGTTRPERFPENLSHGCITLLDDDLVELYRAVPEGAWIWIER